MNLSFRAFLAKSEVCSGHDKYPLCVNWRCFATMLKLHCSSNVCAYSIVIEGSSLG